MDKDAAIRNINAHVSRYADTHGIKKEYIAEQIGIGRTTFYTKLRGYSDFNIFEARALADLIGITVDELLDTEPAPQE